MRFVSSTLHCAYQSQRKYDPRATDDKPQMCVENKAIFMSCIYASLNIGTSLFIYLNSSCLFPFSPHSCNPFCFLSILRQSGRCSGNCNYLRETSYSPAVRGFPQILMANASVVPWSSRLSTPSKSLSTLLPQWHSQLPILYLHLEKRSLKQKLNLSIIFLVWAG